MDFIRTTSMEHTLSVLEAYGSAATLLAGGTDVFAQLPRGELTPGVLVHIMPVPGLSSVVLEGGAISIGALASHRRIAVDGALGGFGSLRQAAAQIGGWQTQAVGTIGGNVCNASPAADLLPPLLIHDARVALVSASRGERSLPVSDFVKGRHATAREADELVTSFLLEPPGTHTADIYLKVGRRSAMEVAILGLALRLTLDDRGRVAQARVATCAASPCPMRITAVEEILQGEELSADLIAEAGQSLRSSLSPIDDVRGSAAYRLAVAPRLLARAIEQTKVQIMLANSG
ncbi:MAG: FAD binding domain-containing protein [Kiritimatiellia bacterium]|nr:FAD binding domain-containing protein [Pseudomonadales bacterium]MDP7024038.1 FAD binding domain-containing protein [Kiritimatiellia bacterium]